MFVLVTGAAGGIGQAITAAALAAGHEVVALDQVAPPHDPRVHHIAVDLIDEAATRAAAAEACEHFEIAGIVHNAGVIRPALVADVNPADMLDLARLHLAAPLILLQAALPGMRSRRFGRVVLISSRAALGAVTRTSYGATKAGIIGMVRTWALELAGDGITVNAIAPGPIGGTAMFHDVVPAGSEREAKLAASIPVRRLGKPEDVARAAAFFLDAKADFITGQTLFVCGGASVGSLAI
jgi:3-oxoacyl-[acyl-carrier protein] reductase